MENRFGGYAPDYPDGYLCGIELDGKDHLRQSARDRDIEILRDRLFGNPKGRPSLEFGASTSSRTRKVNTTYLKKKSIACLRKKELMLKSQLWSHLRYRRKIPKMNQYFIGNVLIQPLCEIFSVGRLV